jgi:hypothetical protein
MIAPTDSALYQEILKAFQNLAALVTAILTLLTAKYLRDKVQADEGRGAQDLEEDEKKRGPKLAATRGEC